MMDSVELDINDQILDVHPETRILEPRSIYDTAVVGYDEDNQCLLYDGDTLIHVLMENMDEEIEDPYSVACDHIGYNICGHHGQFYPLVKWHE